MVHARSGDQETAPTCLHVARRNPNCNVRVEGAGRPVRSCQFRPIMSRAMICFMISALPPAMRDMRLSAQARAMG